MSCLPRASRHSFGFFLLAVLIISAKSGLGQNAAPAPDAAQPACAPLSDTEIPVATTIQAKTAGGLDAAHIKAGKKFWINVARGVVFPSCTMENDAAIYGTVLEASAVKSPPSSELAMKFDHVDCEGKGKKEMTLWLVALIGPAEEGHRSHDDMPSQVAGGSRQVDNAPANGHDQHLNPGGVPDAIKPGAVVGLNGVKLEPQGGPSCSARLTSETKVIALPPGTLLLLAARAGE